MAVVQGLSLTICWDDLAEAAPGDPRAGALWVTTNLDVTLPTERGLLPGNGSMVAALRATTDVKPRWWPASRSRLSCTTRWPAAPSPTPLVVGDRLDTDIAGANAAGLPSLMVLTGVSTAAEAVHAAPARPTYVGADLRSLLQTPEQLAVGPQPAWNVEVSGGVATVQLGGRRSG